METTVDRYTSRDGTLVIHVDFWDDEQDSLGHVTFSSDGRGARPMWQVSFHGANDPRYERGVTFHVAVGDELRGALPDRDKRRLGMHDWLLIETAYDAAFGGRARENPAPDPARRAGYVWRVMLTSGGREKYEGALAYGGTTLLLHKYLRASARHRWRAAWKVALTVKNGRILGTSGIGFPDVLVANDLYRVAIAEGDTGTYAW